MCAAADHCRTSNGGVHGPALQVFYRLRRGRRPRRPVRAAPPSLRRAGRSCCGAQNFRAALRRPLKILTAATRSSRFIRHRRRSIRSPHPTAVPPHRKKPLPHRRVYRCGNFPSYFIPSKNSDRDFCTSCLSRSGRMFPRSSQVNMFLKTSGMASYCRSSCA